MQPEESRLRKIADTLPTYIAYVDGNLRYLMANRMYERQFGLTAGEIVGRSVAEVVGASFETVASHLRAALAGRTQQFETQMRTVDGIRYLDVSHIPDLDAEGRVQGVIVHGLDVTDRRRAEQALHASEDRLRMALDAASGVGTWDWDLVDNLFYADAGFAHLYRVDPQEAQRGTSNLDFRRNIHPDDLERVAQASDLAIRGGAEYMQEYRLLQPDGTARWVSAVGRCTCAPDGTPLRFAGVTFDITARKQTEETLRASEERLRIAADTAKLGTWELDLATGKLICSDLFKQSFGFGLHEAFDYATMLSRVHPEDREARDRAVQEAIASGETYRSEYRVLWPDESLHWMVASGRVVRREDGVAVKAVGVTLDVTERHHATEALMQSEKLAAVGRLASSIAHEINNPLESVMNLLYLSRQSAQSSSQTSDQTREVLTYLDMADQELRRVAVIANQTLRFHKQSTKPRLASCEELIETVLSIYQGRLANSGVKVEKRKRAQRPAMCFDGEIRQVLNNLVGNAIDAMPHGGRLLIRSRETTQWQTGRRGLALTFADTGAGMSAQTARKIFTPFFTTKGIGGTGLGLWVSQEIVARHRGSLRVRSSQAAGRSGTVFVLFLPFDFLNPDGVAEPPVSA